MRNFMKLRILSTIIFTTLLFAGFIESEAITCAQITPSNLVNKCKFWYKKQQICSFVKKHQYKIAAAVGATISLGVAAYCYYHGLPTFLEKLGTKNEKCERHMVFEFPDENVQELEKIALEMEKIINDRAKTPQEKYQAVKKYYESFSEISARYFEIIDGRLINKTTKMFITVDQMQKTHFEAARYFTQIVDGLKLLSSQRDQLVNDYRRVDLLSFEKHIKQYNIDKWSSSTMKELRFMFIKEFMYHELIGKMKATESKNDILPENQENKKTDENKEKNSENLKLNSDAPTKNQNDLQNNAIDAKREKDNSSDTKQKSWLETKVEAGKKWLAEKLDAEKKANEANAAIKNENQDDWLDHDISNR